MCLISCSAAPRRGRRAPNAGQRHLRCPRRVSTQQPARTRTRHTHARTARHCRDSRERCTVDAEQVQSAQQTRHVVAMNRQACNRGKQQQQHFGIMMLMLPAWLAGRLWIATRWAVPHAALDGSRATVVRTHTHTPHRHPTRPGAHARTRARVRTPPGTCFLSTKTRRLISARWRGAGRQPAQGACHTHSSQQQASAPASPSHAKVREKHARRSAREVHPPAPECLVPDAATAGQQLCAHACSLRQTEPARAPP